MSDRDEQESEAEASADEAPKRRRAPVRDEAQAEGDGSADRPAPAKRKVDYTFLAVWSAVFLAADLGTKWWATKTLTARSEAIVILPKLLKFDLAHNRGGAWSLLAEQPASVRLPFFFAVSAAAAIFIVSLYRKLEPRQKALKWALPLVLGGALGNLVDRVRYEHVIDFIDPYDYWPTFNVADIWIVAGVLLMAIDMFVPRSREERIAEARERRQKAESDEAERRTREAEEPGT